MSGMFAYTQAYWSETNDICSHFPVQLQMYKCHPIVMDGKYVYNSLISLMKTSLTHSCFTRTGDYMCVFPKTVCVNCYWHVKSKQDSVCKVVYQEKDITGLDLESVIIPKPSFNQGVTVCTTVLVIYFLALSM